MVEMVELREGLRKLGELMLPVRVAYRIAKILEGVEAEGKRYDQLRAKLFEKHGTKDAKRPELLTIPPQAQEAFGAEMNLLLLLDVELKLEPCVSIDELGDVQIAPADLARCRAIIKEP
jgi:hypothetical protein